MAMDVESGRILTTGGGWGDSGGYGIWMLLLVFLFMFRGHGFGGGDGDGHRGGEGDYYRRGDAHFDHLNRNEWELQKEGLVGRYETRLQNEHCCCETNMNIKDVKCAVESEGGKTRAHETDLYMRGLLDAKNEKIMALETKLNRRETVDETLAGVRRMMDERFAYERGGYGRGRGCCNERPVMAYDEPVKYVPEVRRDDRFGDDFYRFEAI